MCAISQKSDFPLGLRVFSPGSFFQSSVFYAPPAPRQEQERTQLAKGPPKEEMYYCKHLGNIAEDWSLKL